MNYFLMQFKWMRKKTGPKFPFIRNFLWNSGESKDYVNDFLAKAISSKT